MFDILGLFAQAKAAEQAHAYQAAVCEDNMRRHREALAQRDAWNAMRSGRHPVKRFPAGIGQSMLARPAGFDLRPGAVNWHFG